MLSTKIVGCPFSGEDQPPSLIIAVIKLPFGLFTANAATRVDRWLLRCLVRPLYKQNSGRPTGLTNYEGNPYQNVT
ncbi:hypothetical protein RRG08_001079 [Elysia crispata]|uniref:Uncharacterized protein n=1 Tax=Elysia crispata TaxID=231223 RepID=A0AAE1AW22_9GAST|nr:hypothetical protein RRG08_001079 [Elysia crispata]